MITLSACGARVTNHALILGSNVPTLLQSRGSSTSHIYGRLREPICFELAKQGIRLLDKEGGLRKVDEGNLVTLLMVEFYVSRNHPSWGSRTFLDAAIYHWRTSFPELEGWRTRLAPKGEAAYRLPRSCSMDVKNVDF
ncbi:hypothetical protein BT69DRAFT_335420 [Atractiella rhizophila]|nr:hypothetical protein BT69DRAFT_335420 [Atractiella rhizophila]